VLSEHVRSKDNIDRICCCPTARYFQVVLLHLVSLQLLCLVKNFLLNQSCQKFRHKYFQDLRKPQLRKPQLQETSIRIKETSMIDTLPGYNLINENSQTQAGGVGAYIKNNLKYLQRRDLQFKIHDVKTYGWRY